MGHFKKAFLGIFLFLASLEAHQVQTIGHVNEEITKQEKPNMYDRMEIEKERNRQKYDKKVRAKAKHFPTSNISY